MPEVEFKGSKWNSDEDGFIDDFKNWNKEWVEYVAGLEGVKEKIGKENFIEVKTTLPALFGSNAQWADYDKDGDLDLALMGVINKYTGDDFYDPFTYYNSISNIYKQNGERIFSKNILLSTPISYGEMDWGDFNILVTVVVWYVDFLCCFGFDIPKQISVESTIAFSNILFKQ